MAQMITVMMEAPKKRKYIPEEERARRTGVMNATKKFVTWNSCSWLVITFIKNA